MARTDFTSEIDGALANRNAGSGHFSEIARSGNGNMMTDLAQDLTDYQEVDGVGEGVEELTRQESASVDANGAQGKYAQFRHPAAGEVPPFAAKPGYIWLRRRILTQTRKPGGARLVRLKWVQVTSTRLSALKQEGGMGDLGMSGTVSIMASAGIGLAGGLVLWMLLRKGRK